MSWALEIATSMNDTIGDAVRINPERDTVIQVQILLYIHHFIAERAERSVSLRE